MSIDHNYARGKLKLLLRDLSNYNAGEFWREMSRIASGATASTHAEGLKAERNALADSNAQLSQQNEAQIRMNAKLMHERDALAALFFKLQGASTDLIHASNEEEAGDAMELIAECSEENARKVLARRDANQREESLRETAKWFAALYTSTELLSAEVVYDILMDQARRQAEACQ
ncbi:MAG: hypothetical protein ACTID3_15430 [Halomonas sp.]|uniref:hypothetical protein n=1 Tax=Halomonas sp. TaxID=1486246 RepID=UPI003F8E3D41